MPRLVADLILPVAGTTGAPSSGAHVTGELWVDSAGSVFVCTAGGTPGTWAAAASGGTTYQAGGGEDPGLIVMNIGAMPSGTSIPSATSFGTPGSSAPADAAAQGSATTLARSDHKHGREVDQRGLPVLGGLTGATAATRYAGGTGASSGGPPTSGTFAVGDFVTDQWFGCEWVCTAGGTPGTWAVVGTPYLGFSGAPTSGHWNQGALAIDSNNVVWQCTASGTPGSWVSLSPKGTLASGYARVTSSQGPTAPSFDITGAAVTVTLASGRRYRISAQALITSSVNTDAIQLAIIEGATDIMLANETQPAAAGVSGSNRASVIRTCPSDIAAGSVTYKLAARRNGGGTGNFTNNAAAAFPTWILVEDIGV